MGITKLENIMKNKDIIKRINELETKITNLPQGSIS